MYGYEKVPIIIPSMVVTHQICKTNDPLNICFVNSMFLLTILNRSRLLLKFLYHTHINPINITLDQLVNTRYTHIVSILFHLFGNYLQGIKIYLLPCFARLVTNPYD